MPLNLCYVQELVQRILRFSKSPFVRNVTIVATGTAASQAISMAFSPLITRLYGPAAYGILGVFLSIASIMGAIAAMTYPIAIILPKNDADAFGLARLSVLIGFVMALVATILLHYFGAGILNLLNAAEILAFVYLIPLFMLISVLTEVMSQWLIRKKAFELNAKVAVCQSLLTSIFKAGFGFAYPTASALVVTSTLTGFLSPVLMLLGVRRISNGHHIHHSNQRNLSAEPSIWSIARLHRDFPLLRTPQVLINTLSQSLPILLLASYFGSTSAGFYSIAISVLSAPMALIGGSVVQVFYPRFNEAVINKQNAVALLTKATLGMALLGIVPFGIIAIFGSSLFEFVFGVEWRTAGEYSQWLAIWLFVAFTNRPAVSAVAVVRIQGVLLVYELISVLVRVAALHIGFVLLKSDIASVAAFSIVGCALNGFWVYYVIRVCQDITLSGR